MVILSNTQNIEDLEKLKEAAAELSEVEASQVAKFFQETVIPNLIGIGFKILVVLVVYFVGSRCIKLARKIIKRSLERANADIGLIQFIDSLTKVGLYMLLVIGLVSWVGKVGVSLAALIGSLGVAIGLAVQGSLSNFVGGVLILLLRPFSVGDYIIEDTNKNEGTVKEIQMFYTKLVTADNKVIVIPNGVLSNSSLTNVTDQSKRRLELFVGIGYQADLALAKKVLSDILQSHDAVMKDQEIQVFVEALEASSVKLGVRAWVPTERCITAKWEITEEIKNQFDKNGIEIPYAKLDVHMQQ